MSGLFASKKFWTALITIATAVILLVAGQGLITEEQAKFWAALVTVVGTGLIGAFGLADVGKEKAKEETKRSIPPMPSGRDITT